MLDGLLGRGFSSKCKSLIKLIRSRIDVIQKKRSVVLKYLKKDISDLLKNGLDINAYGKTEGLLIEMNLSSCYDLIEQFCGCILEHLSIMQKQRDCPPESREAASNLMFAAARFADLPELRDLRRIFSERYGSTLESSVNREFLEKIASKPPSTNQKLQLMQDISRELSINWDSRALKEMVSDPSAFAWDQPTKRGPPHNGKDETIIGKRNISSHGRAEPTPSPQYKTRQEGIDAISSRKYDHPPSEFNISSRRRAVPAPSPQYKTRQDVEADSRGIHAISSRKYDPPPSEFNISSRGRAEPAPSPQYKARQDVEADSRGIHAISSRKYDPPPSEFNISSRGRAEPAPSPQYKTRQEVEADSRGIHATPSRKYDPPPSEFNISSSGRAEHAPGPRYKTRKEVEANGKGIHDIPSRKYDPPPSEFSISSRGRAEPTPSPRYKTRQEAEADSKGIHAISSCKYDPLPSEFNISSRGRAELSPRPRYTTRQEVEADSNGIHVPSSKTDPSPSPFEFNIVTENVKLHCAYNMAPPPYVKPKDTRYGTNSEASWIGSNHNEPTDLSIENNGSVIDHIRPEMTREGSDHIHHKRQVVGQTRSTGSGDEKDHPHLDIIVHDSKPKSRSARRKHMKPAVHVDGPTEGNARASRNPSARRRQGVRRSTRTHTDDHNIDDEEEFMDRLLIHYSKKQSTFDDKKIGIGLKAHIQSTAKADESSTSQTKDEARLKPVSRLPPTRAVSLPPERTATEEVAPGGPVRATSFQPDACGGHVHPKLPDYDDLVARFAALRTGCKVRVGGT
ncbi:uncharacterized protein LOC143879421 [Tasmannia lanceolata]|uniref:uncharacterized protein LOC143879421 n=1 Tax=Tasmannia lanceolata TaxID=3420 RepID=UPI004063373C